MAQGTLNNGDLGSVFRATANDNFTELYTNKADLATEQTFTAAQTGSTQVVTTSGAVELDFDQYNNFIITLNGNITLSDPTTFTPTVGQSGFITFKQDGVGTRTLAFAGTAFLNAGGTTPVLSTAINSIDVIAYAVIGAGQIVLGAPALAFS